MPQLSVCLIQAELESAKDELTKLGECRMQADKDKKSYRTQLKELKRNEKHVKGLTAIIVIHSYILIYREY